MTWTGLLQHALHTLAEWWPSVLIVGSVLGAIWGFLRLFTQRIVWAIIKAGVLGKAQDKAESELRGVMENLVQKERDYHAAEVALVRTQVMDQLAEKDMEIAVLRRETAEAKNRAAAADEKSKACAAECGRLSALVAQLTEQLDHMARGDLSQWDRRQVRGGSSEDRKMEDADGPV